MLLLKTLLQYKYLAISFFLIVLIISGFRLAIIPKSRLDIGSSALVGKVIEYHRNKDQVKFIIDSVEKVSCTYYLKDEEEITFIDSIKLGNTVKLEGTIESVGKNTIPNTFNYQKYLSSKNIYRTMDVEKIELISSKTTFIYTIKNTVIDYLASFKSKGYLNAFVTGDRFYLNDDIYATYQELGISHIFAISGSHINILSAMIIFCLKKINKNIRDIFLISFMLFYMFLTSYSASIVRSVALFIALFFNRRLSLVLRTIDCLYWALAILLIINPYLLYDIGFLYSSVVTWALIKHHRLINGNYFVKSLKISLIAFLYSLPITIYYNYEFNIFSVLNNLFFVPLISFIIYPFCLLVLIIRPLDSIFLSVIELVETLAIHAPVFNVVIPKPNIFVIIAYYLCLVIFFQTYNKKYLLFIVLGLLFWKYKAILDNNYYVYFLDVSQGDSIVIKHRNSTIMVDTGGIVSYKREEWRRKSDYYVSDNTIKFLKSIGTTRLDYLILTHGDTDHLGDAIHIVENFEVINVVFNRGGLNDLELKIIDTLSKYNISYYQNLDFLRLGNAKLYFINSQIYDNENDNSIVIYANLKGINLLLMGDAGLDTELELIKNYNLEDIDILKVGHHGSNTSSGKYFINTTNPRYSIISVGKNNRYNHPHDSVLNNLGNSNIYRTDEQGSITIKITDKKMKITNCI